MDGPEGGGEGGGSKDLGGEGEADVAAEYMAQVNAEKEANAKAAADLIIAEKKREERKAKEWHEWRCVTCGKENRRPAFPKPEISVSFDEKGRFIYLP